MACPRGVGSVVSGRGRSIAGPRETPERFLARLMPHRPRDPYGPVLSFVRGLRRRTRSVRAHDGVPVSYCKSESALTSRLLEICSNISICRVPGVCFFPNFESRPNQARLFHRGTPYLSQSSRSSTERRRTPTRAFRVLLFGADFSR